MTDYFIQLVKFPSGKVHEAVTENEDGTMTVFLDVNETKEIQKKRLLHAMRHFDDFGKLEVQKIEYEAHK